MLDEWAEMTKEAAANRIQRYFLTGNILKSAVLKDVHHGRFVSFNVISGDGENRLNGVMLPSSFKPQSIATKLKSYPVASCRKLFMPTENNNFTKPTKFNLPNSGSLTMQKTARLGYGINLIIPDITPCAKAIVNHKYIDEHVYQVYEGKNYYWDNKIMYYIDFNTDDLAPFVDMLSECSVEIELDPNRAKALFGTDDTEALRDGWWPMVDANEAIYG